LVGFDGLAELVDCWWDLQSLHKDTLLSLEENVSWPSDETGQVTSVLDVVADTEVSWSRLEERVSLDVCDLLDGLSTLFLSTFAH